MYKILVDGNYIFDDATNLEEYKLIKPKLTLAVNQAGSLSFKLPPSNRGYDEEGVLNKQVLVLKNGDALWYGRVMTESVDIWGNRDIYCEGELSFLNDTHQPQGKWLNMSIEGFLTQLINVHNSHVAASKQFRVGNVTVTDPDLSPESTIYRFTNWETTWDCIQDKLLDRFGGYLQVRYVNNVRYLDYLAAIPTVGGQNITFGKNLLDFTRNFDANDIKTVIVPFGAALDEEAVEGLTAYLDVKSVNGGSPYVYNQSAVNEFGWVEEVVHWDDVTQPANLLRNAQNYLQDVQYEKMIIDLNAFDLNRIDPSIPSLECGELVYVQSDVHNLHRNFLVSKVVLQLDDPGQDEYVLGAESKTILFSDSVQTEIQKNYKRTEQKGNDISNLKQAAITDVEVYYAQGNSATEAPSSGWSPVAPVWENGKYMWQYTHTRKANGTDDDSDPTNITGAKGDKGDDGDSGVSVTSSTEQYYLSTSAESPTGGSWSNSVPAYISGRYYWTRTHTTFSDGTSSDSTPVIDLGLTDANQRAALADDKADNISRGLITNYYTKTDVDQGMQELEGEILSTVSNSYVDQSTYATDIDNLQQQIDGAIETFTGSEVPTLNNYPASDWNTDTKKDQHIGDLYLVNSSGGSQAGFYYRFEKNNGTYSWVHVPDSDVQKALADAAAANAAAIAAQDTADGIAEDLQQNYYTSTQTESAIDQKADDILLQVGSTYATQSTVNTVKNSTIKSDVLHYLATSAGSGVTRSTPGWTTTVQSMTQEKQYLWTYHTYTYGDDHTSDTDPIITGRYGQNGSQGPQGATGPQGPQGSQGDPGDDGTSIVEVIPLKYAGNSTTAPAAPTANVTRIDAATGVWTRGVPALTNTYKYMYTCDQVKYSNNTYTWTSVVLDNAITNLTQRMTQAELDLQPDSITAKVESTNTFTTIEQFNNLEIGGENLLKETNRGITGWDKTIGSKWKAPTFESINWLGRDALKVTGNGVNDASSSSSWYVLMFLPPGGFAQYLIPNTEYTISFDSTFKHTRCQFQQANGQGAALTGYISLTSISKTDQSGNTYWHHTGTGKTKADFIGVDPYWTRVYFDDASYFETAGSVAKYANLKIEEGNKSTDWSPAPEDNQPVGTNLLRYAPKSKAPASYQALQLNLTEKLIKGQTYTLQLWDIDISHTGKQASDLNVSVFAGGGNNLLATITGFTNGHADYKVATFTVSLNPNQPTHLDNLWLNIYNSVPNASGTMNLTIGRWKLEKGNKATEWQMNPIDASSKSEVQQLSNMVAVKVNSSGRLVTAALGVDPASATSYLKVKADDIDIISNGNIQLTGKSIGITSTNFSVTAAGAITAKSGTIGGWSISDSQLYKTVSSGSSGRYASYLQPNELKVSYAAGSAAISSETYVKSGLVLVYGQNGGYSGNKAVIIDGDGQSLGYDFSMIKSFGAMLTYIVPSTGNEISINGGVLTVKSNGWVNVDNTFYASSEIVSGTGIELGAASNGSLSFIDFHWNTTMSGNDFTARICQRAESTVDLIGKNSSTWGIWRAGSFSSQSSIHAKENIKDISDDEAKKILELRPVSFDYKNGGTKDQRGLIAEEVLDILPNMVIGADIEYNEDEPWNTPSIDYSRFVPYLIKMMQVQQREIDILKSK